MPPTKTRTIIETFRPGDLLESIWESDWNAGDIDNRWPISYGDKMIMGELRPQDNDLTYVILYHMSCNKIKIYMGSRIWITPLTYIKLSDAE